MAKTRHSNASPTPTKKKAKEKEAAQEMNQSTSPIQHICRTCLEEIQASSLIPLNDSSSNIRNELRACIPEVDFDLVPNAGMCTYCLNALHVAYEFKQKCLQTEDKIRKQLHRKLLVDLTKLKKTTNIVVTNGDGLGLDVIYINDPIEIMDGEVETVNPFASLPKSQTSTPFLDEEIEMINSSVNINNDDEVRSSSDSIQEEMAPNKYLCNDDELVDGDVEIVSTNKIQETNLLLGLSESAPRKPLNESTVTNKRKNKINYSADVSLKSKRTKIESKDLQEKSGCEINEKPSSTNDTSAKSSGGAKFSVDAKLSENVKVKEKCLDKNNLPESNNKPNDKNDKTLNKSNLLEEKTKVNRNSTHGFFCCSVCKKSFKEEALYIEHVKQHKIKIYVCNGCKFHSKGVPGFKMHLKSCKQSKALLKQTPTKDLKKISPQFKCTNCKYVTPMKLVYKKHVRNCTDTSTNNVPKQVKSETPESTRQSKVNSKMTLKSKEKTVKESFQIKKGKVETSHSPVSQRVEEINTALSERFGSISELICRFCDYTNEDSSTFEAHVFTHCKTEFPYTCKDRNCHFRSRNKAGLFTHMTNHYGDRSFHCTKCTYQCLSMAALHGHLKRHTKSKGYKETKRH